MKNTSSQTKTQIENALSLKYQNPKVSIPTMKKLNIEMLSILDEMQESSLSNEDLKKIRKLERNAKAIRREINAIYNTEIDTQLINFFR